MALLATALLAGCDEENTLLPIAWIDSGPLTAEALDMHTVQLRWSRVEGGRSYHIERRANLTGDFTTVESVRNLTSAVDADLTPGTTYGYRLRVENDLGQVVATSTVTAARTPPVPGIEVEAKSQLGAYSPQAVDSSGYRVRITGPNTDAALPIEVVGTALLEPLAPGSYSVAIDDIASQCQLTNGPASRTASVTDQGLSTRVRITFDVLCRARDRGRLTVQTTFEGDTTDVDGVRLVLSGAAADTTLPASERAIVINRTVGVPGVSATTTFDDLRPGTYSLLLDQVSPLCTVAGTRQRDTISIAALGDAAQTFALTCTQPSTGDRPFIFKTTWSRDTAAVGSTVTAAVSLDLRAEPTLDATAVQFVVRTPNATSIVRADSVVLANSWTGVSNLTTPGQFQVVATNLGGPTGLVPILTAYYTVVGANGDKARTQAQIANLASGAGSEFQSRVRLVEDTLVVGTGGSAGGPPGGGGGDAQTTPFTWGLHFGSFDTGTQTVPVDITLDLSTNIPETPTAEQLQDWAVDSLKWNKNVLQFNSFQRASGTSTVNFIEALSRGVLRLRGTVAAAQSTGVVQIGTVNFAVIGHPGDQTTMASFLGANVGTAATGAYDYTPRTVIQNATYTVPSSAPATAYPLTVSWSAVAGGQATMSVGINMAALNDPANHGAAADKIGAFQATFGFSASRLTGAVCNGQSGFSGVFNTQTAGTVTTVLTNLSGASGNVPLLSCTFAVAGTGPTTVAVSGLLASDELGVADFTSKIDVVVTPLP